MLVANGGPTLAIVLDHTGRPVPVAEADVTLQRSSLLDTSWGFLPPVSAHVSMARKGRT